MCMFCVAVPTVAAVGLAARGKQQEKINQAAARGEPPPRPVAPVGRVTAVVLAAILVIAAVYHTQPGAG